MSLLPVMTDRKWCLHQVLRKRQSDIRKPVGKVRSLTAHRKNPQLGNLHCSNCMAGFLQHRCLENSTLDQIVRP